MKKRPLSEMKKMEALKCLQILQPTLVRRGLEAEMPFWKTHTFESVGITGATGFFLKNPANDYYLSVDETEREVCLMNPKEGDYLDRCSVHLRTAKELIEYLESVGFEI